MRVQLGGGTDIAQALRYASQLVENPDRTVLVLVTDFCEGGPPGDLVRVVSQLAEARVTLLGLAALDGEAHPFYDRAMAQRLADRGMEIAALTPQPAGGLAGRGDVVTAYDELLAQLGRYDDDAWAAVANRGLLRRARKDLESLAVVARVVRSRRRPGGRACQVSFGASGPSGATCSCPAATICQHVITAGAVARLVVATPPSRPTSTVELMAIDADALASHAGRAGLRWAAQYVADLDDDQPRITPGSGGAAVLHHTAPDLPVHGWWPRRTHPRRAAALAREVRRRCGARLPARPRCRGGPDRAGAAARDRHHARPCRRPGALLAGGRRPVCSTPCGSGPRTCHRRCTSATRRSRCGRRASSCTGWRCCCAGSPTRSSCCSTATPGPTSTPCSTRPRSPTRSSPRCGSPASRCPSRLAGQSRTTYSTVRSMELVGLGGTPVAGGVGLPRTDLPVLVGRGAAVRVVDRRPARVDVELRPARSLDRSRHRGPGCARRRSPPAAPYGSPTRRSRRPVGSPGSSGPTPRSAPWSSPPGPSMPVVSSWTALEDRVRRGQSLLDQPDPLREWVLLRPELLGPRGLRPDPADGLVGAARRDRTTARR